MRRLAAPLLAVLVLAGCSGEQGERAQALLTRAQTAQARLSSMGYEVRMTFSIDGQKAALVLDGGGYLKGRRAGDQLVTMRVEGVPGMAATNVRMVLRGRRMSFGLNGRQTSLTVPVQSKAQYDLSGSVTELARYVKDVRVHENRVVNGERGATVTGVIDTEGLLKAAAKLQALTQASGTAAPDMSKLAEHVGDTRAALFIARRTGLIRSAVIGVSLEAGGKTVDLDLTYRLKHVNRAIPGL
ncbi:MAG TPA: hypothetical protein VHH55_08745 [Gaiellaceae bacterium]|jgi:hypothetical protein|nr:hypothetical protein [Gaiellaceae bacterium]